MIYRKIRQTLIKFFKKASLLEKIYFLLELQDNFVFILLILEQILKLLSNFVKTF